MTPAEKLALRTHIQANQTQLAFGGGTATIAATFAASPLNAGDAKIIADWYSALASPDHWIVRRDVAPEEIEARVLGTRYTPSPAISGGNAAQHTAASNACMCKLSLLAFIVPPTRGFDATVNTRTASLKDATTALPSGGSFANQDAGWDGGNGISNVLVRKATNLEFVFKLNSGVPALNDGVTVRGGWNTGTGLGNPDTTSITTGAVTGDEISDIKGLPA